MIYSVCERDTGPSVKYLMREEKGLQSVCKLLLESKTKILFKRQILFKITKKFAKKRLDVSS